MRKKLITISAGFCCLLAGALTMNAQQKSLKLDKVGVVGASYVAIANDPGLNGSLAFCFKPGDEAMPVNYNFSCEGLDADGLLALNRNLRLNVGNILSIGSDYFWFCFCTLECQNINAVPEAAREAVKEAIAKSKLSNKLNFIVRKSDGKAFECTQKDGLPISNGHITNGGAPIAAMTGEALEGYGLITPKGKDLFVGTGYYYGMIRKFTDTGDELEISNLISNGIANAEFIIPDDKGVNFGYILSYESCYPAGSTIGFPKSLSAPRINGLPNNAYGFWEMFKANGTFYVAAGGFTDKLSFYKVSVGNRSSSAVKVASTDLPFKLHDTYFTAIPRAYKGSKISWICNKDGKDYAVTFDAAKDAISSAILPVGFPADDIEYHEGTAYAMESDCSAFHAYSLSALSDQKSSVNRASVPAIEKTVSAPAYNCTIGAFIEEAYSKDGKYMLIITDVAGPLKGISRVLYSGQTSGGKVIVNIVK